MAILSREQIDKAADLSTRDVPCPEWGGDVRLRMLTGTERDAFKSAVAPSDGPKNAANLRARLVSMCAVDEQGRLLYPPPDGAAAMGKRSGVVLDRLFDEARALNGMRKADVEAAKNASGGDPSAASTTDSPSSSDAPSANSSPASIPPS